MAAEESASHELEDAYENDFEDEQYDREAHVTSTVAQAAAGRTYSSDEVRSIERQNLALLGRLDEINRKTSTITTDTRRKPVKHVAAAAINRKKQHQQVHHENLAFLKRLENVKSTMGTSRSAGQVRAKAKPGPPRSKRQASKLQLPEWKD